MTRPLPPHSGRSTRNKPNLRANRHPERRPAKLASEISSTEIQAVRIRFSEKLISRFSACPRLRNRQGQHGVRDAGVPAELTGQQEHRNRRRR
ncbi:MAG: hypothetical protein ACXVBG_15985 [Isosphaeraceae bacterium]